MQLVLECMVFFVVVVVRQNDIRIVWTCMARHVSGVEGWTRHLKLVAPVIHSSSLVSNATVGDEKTTYSLRFLS